jgi:GNAT superfamily N-acetyltransferase
MRGRLVAYAEVLRGWPDANAWAIGILLVDAQMRSQGLGTEVLEAIMQDARAAGMNETVVGVISSRERSLSFWQREGFSREILRRPFAVGDDHCEIVRLARSL